MAYLQPSVRLVIERLIFCSAVGALSTPGCKAASPASGVLVSDSGSDASGATGIGTGAAEAGAEPADAAMPEDEMGPDVIQSSDAGLSIGFDVLTADQVGTPPAEAGGNPDGSAADVDGQPASSMLACPGAVTALPYVMVAVDVQEDAATPAPAFTGGAIADGEYLLTSCTAYGPCGSGITPLGALTFNAGFLRIEAQDPPNGDVRCLIESYAILGNEVVSQERDDGGPLPLYPASHGPIPYSVSSDGRTLEVELGSCTDGHVTGTNVGAYVRQ